MAHFEIVEEWESRPMHLEHLDVSDVAVDSQDRVYLLTRFDARVIVYARDGSFLHSWGDGAFTHRPHGITIGADDTVYVVDEDDHTVKKFTVDGKPLGVIGRSGVASDTGADWTLPDMRERLASVRYGGPPFNHPTALAIAPNGDLFVADGYANARVHKFSREGELIMSWGEPGREPGQFHIPHAVCVAPDARVLVADRENDRIQLFTENGEFIEQWTDVQRPTAIAIDGERHVIVAELSWLAGQDSGRYGRAVRTMPSRMSVLDANGNVMSRFGSGPPCDAGQFAAPHGIALDSRGDMYVAEVTYSFAKNWLGRDDRTGYDPQQCHTIQKFARV